MGSLYSAYSLLIIVIVEFNFRMSIAAAISEQLNSTVEIQNNVCKTLVCNHEASQILNNIDETIDPCDNFYKFACGGFLQKTTIPDGETKIDSFTITKNIVAEQLKNSLAEPSLSDELRPLTLVKNFYKSCMNQDVIENRGYQPLQKILKEMGGWPVLEGHQWVDTNFNWIESIYKFHKIGYPSYYFLNLFVDVDSTNISKKILKLGNPVLTESPKIIIEAMNNTKIRAYYEFMVEVAVLLGASRDYANVELNESFKFEIDLANITLLKSEHPNAHLLHHPTTVAELSESYPSIPWKEYINNILAPHVVIDDSEIVVVDFPGVIPRLIKLMNETPKRVQANYIMWKAVEYSVNFLLTQDMQKISLKYMSGQNRVNELQPQWKTCLDHVSILRSFYTLYVKKYFTDIITHSVNKLTDRITSTFHNILKTVNWMDDEARRNALNSVAAMKMVIGYPAELINENELEEFYKNLKFDDDNYLGNRLKLNLHIADRKYGGLRHRVTRTSQFYGYVADVNAYYSPYKKNLFIPAAILQGIFFNAERPTYMNFGTLGVIISHEITHAFDDDNRGKNLEDGMSTTNEYLRKTQCIADQYSNYIVEEIGRKLNGTFTLRENIADNSGFKIAYLAYKDWLNEYKKEQRLPGLQYNSQQLFWISAANMWCSKIRRDHININSDPHAPKELRILGSLSNMPEFAQDFNCPIGSRMNPVKKCTLW